MLVSTILGYFIRPKCFDRGYVKKTFNVTNNAKYTDLENSKLFLLFR